MTASPDRSSSSQARQFEGSRKSTRCSKIRRMAKRPNPRAVKAVRTCTVPEAAQTLGVTVGTVRSWIKHGMRAMTMQRPHLILGEDVREYLAFYLREAKRCDHSTVDKAAEAILRFEASTGLPLPNHIFRCRVFQSERQGCPNSPCRTRHTLSDVRAVPQRLRPDARQH